jgi:hypothetical protein
MKARREVADDPEVVREDFVKVIVPVKESW